MKPLRVKRVYEPSSESDGVRVLVDRLRPRGTSKEKAKIDLWLKDISPSDALRKTYHAEPEKWEQFCSAYAAELTVGAWRLGDKDTARSLQGRSHNVALRGTRRRAQQCRGATGLDGAQV